MVLALFRPASTHPAYPDEKWGFFETDILPKKILIKSNENSIIKSKDLSLYVPMAYYYDYCVIDSFIKDKNENEIGLKVRMEYPVELDPEETGLLDIKVITKDYAYATSPDFQNNLQSFCLINILGDESLRQEQDWENARRERFLEPTISGEMYVDPIILATVPVGFSDRAKEWIENLKQGNILPHSDKEVPLKPLNTWYRYNEELGTSIERDYPNTELRSEYVELYALVIKGAVGTALKVPIDIMLKAVDIVPNEISSQTELTSELTNIDIYGLFAAIGFSLEDFKGINLDDAIRSFSEWQRIYTVGEGASDKFIDENSYDCWTYIYGFNANENYCIGANGVRLIWPFSFDKGSSSENHELFVHIDAMFEGDTPSLGIKGGRIGKEYSLSLPVGQSAEEPTIEVIFPDPNLEAAIRDAIDKPESAIYTSDLERLKILDALEKDIKDITGLEYCNSLKSLSLGGNQITDVKPLSGLTNLEFLTLFNNQIIDVEPLKGLTNLGNLSLADNQIIDVEPLSGLTNLELLLLSNNQITDVEPLSGLTNLKDLYLRNNQITDVEPLSGLTNLELLLLDGNQIADVEPLKGLTNLKGLSLTGNQITDVEPLSGLTAKVIT